MYLFTSYMLTILRKSSNKPKHYHIYSKCSYKDPAVFVKKLKNNLTKKI